MPEPPPPGHRRSTEAPHVDLPADDYEAVDRQMIRLQVSDPPAVLALAEAALRHPRWRADGRVRRRCLTFAAGALRRFGRPAEAEARYLEAIGPARGAGDPKGLCETLLPYAGLLIEEGRFVPAAEVTAEVLETDLVLAEPYVATLALDCVADLAAALGWYDRARHFNNVALLGFACLGRPSMAHIEIQIWQTRCQYTLFDLLDQRHAGHGGAWAATLERFHAEYGRARRRTSPGTTDTDSEMLEHLACLVRWLETEHEGSAAELGALAQGLCAQPAAGPGRYASCRRFAHALAEAHLGQRDRACENFALCLAQTPRGMPALRQAILRASADTHAAAGNWQHAYQARRNAEAERHARVDARVQQHAAALTDRLKRDRLDAEALLNDDLRSPLVAIASLAADRSGRSAERIDATIAQVHGLAGRALFNTEEYLRYAHLQTLSAAQLELLLVPEVLADAVDELSNADPQAAPNLNLSIVNDDEDEDGAQTFLVHGHYTSLRRAFMQLLARAALASPPHGAVEVKLRRDESNVVIAISHQGDGLPLDALAALAAGYHRCARSTSTAADMRYVAEAVRTLGGVVFAANPRGGGSVVMMSFARA